MILSDTAPFLPSGHSEPVSWLWMEGCGGWGGRGNVEWGRMWWTHLTRANRGAIKESAQPERQGLTFIEVDVYCSSCCTCQEGIKDFLLCGASWKSLKCLNTGQNLEQTWTLHNATSVTAISNTFSGMHASFKAGISVQTMGPNP